MSNPFLLSGEIAHPFLTNATRIDFHGCLKILVKIVLQEFIGSVHPSVANLKFCVSLLKCAFTG